MSETADLANRIDALRNSLGAIGGAADDSVRDSIRQEIVSIGRAIDEGIRRLEEMKVQMRPLVASYQAAFPRPPAAAPPRADHLGSSTYRERGWSALAGGEYQTAIQHLRRALELDSADVGTMALLAWGHLRLEQLPQARLLLDAAGGDEGHPLILLCTGQLALKEGEPDRALSIFRSVIDRGGDRTAVLYAHLYLGVGYAQLERHGEAQSAFRHALELGPSLTEAYWELGRSHQQEGRDDLAFEAWRAGGENRFNPWGEQCRDAVERLEAGRSGG